MPSLVRLRKRDSKGIVQCTCICTVYVCAHIHSHSLLSSSCVRVLSCGSIGSHYIHMCVHFSMHTTHLPYRAACRGFEFHPSSSFLLEKETFMFVLLFALIKSNSSHLCMCKYT